MSQELLLMMRFSESASPPPPEACSSLSSSVTSLTLSQDDDNDKSSEHTKIHKDNSEECCKERLKAEEENSLEAQRTSDNGPTMTTSETSKNEPSVEQVSEYQGIVNVNVMADNSEEFVVHTLCTCVQDNNNHDVVKCSNSLDQCKEKSSDVCEKTNTEPNRSNESHGVPRKEFVLISPAINDELTEGESANMSNNEFSNRKETIMTETFVGTNKTENKITEISSSAISNKTNQSQRLLCPPTPSPPRQVFCENDNIYNNNTSKYLLLMKECEYSEMHNVLNERSQCRRPASFLLSPPPPPLLQSRSPSNKSNYTTLELTENKSEILTEKNKKTLSPECSQKQKNSPSPFRHHNQHHRNSTSTYKSTNVKKHNGSRAPSKHRRKVHIKRRRKGQSTSEEEQQQHHEQEQECTEKIENRKSWLELSVSRSLSPLPRCSFSSSSSTAATAHPLKRRAASANASLTVKENGNMHVEKQQEKEQNVNVHHSDNKTKNKELQTKLQAVQELNNQLTRKISILQEEYAEHKSKYEESERERCELRLQISRLHDMFASWEIVTQNISRKNDNDIMSEAQTERKTLEITNAENWHASAIDNILEQLTQLYNNLVTELVRIKLLAVQQQAILDRFDIHEPFSSELTDAAFIAKRRALRPSNEHEILDAISQNKESNIISNDYCRRPKKLVKNIIELKLKQRNENVNVGANTVNNIKESASNIVLHDKHKEIVQTLPARAANIGNLQVNLEYNKGKHRTVKL